MLVTVGPDEALGIKIIKSVKREYINGLKIAPNFLITKPEKKNNRELGGCRREMCQFGELYVNGPSALRPCSKFTAPNETFIHIFSFHMPSPAERVGFCLRKQA